MHTHEGTVTVADCTGHIGYRDLKPMRASGLEDTIRQVAETHRTHARWLSEDKIRARCVLIDPILWALGWRTWDPSQCGHNVNLRRGGTLDYVTYDPEGRVAVALVIGRPVHQRERERQRTATLMTGMIRGVGVLTDGVNWEIYDLALRQRRFQGKLVERFTLDTSDPMELEDAALALGYWLGRDREDHYPGEPDE